MLDQIWMGIIEAFARSEFKWPATAVVAMTTFVASWVLVPNLLRDLRPLQQPGSSITFLRLAIALSLIGGLTFASAAMVQLLPHI